MTYFLDRTRLLELAASTAAAYAAAAPFPHAVFDSFLSADVLDRVLDEFPSPDRDDWWRFDGEHERKLASRDESAMGPVTRQLLHELNAATMLDFLGALTGIGGLVPDPHLHGGGLHQIQAGGFLEVHADFNLHPLTRLQRRLNLLIYLNHDWDPAFGGALELWGSPASGPQVLIEPKFNRAVVFSTTSRSFHGHPRPLACPPDRARRSLAMYYYSLPDRTVRAHNTLFRGDAAPAGSGVARAVRRRLNRFTGAR
ncbi:MAG TPA: 2OG-Fe(II) oxygenase [Mycobacteriales bacterium]|nr:2OG-Fe(II) oxygenase [Mycobacteriales bacterium]